LGIAAIGFPIGRFGPNLYPRSAPADDERDPEAAGPDRSGLRALPDHAADHPRARSADAADPAAVADDPRPRSSQAQTDHPRDAAPRP
jgi:hypothetical protein